MPVPNKTIVRYRAALPAWLFIGGLTNLPWLIAWVNSALGINYMALAFAFFVSGFGLCLLISFQIVITPKELIFRSLFAGKRSIGHDKIKKVSLVWNFWKTKGAPLRLVVKPRDIARQDKQMSINAKVFSRATIDAVLDLGSRVAEADDGGLREGIVLKWLHDSNNAKRT